MSFLCSEGCCWRFGDFDWLLFGIQGNYFWINFVFGYILCQGNFKREKLGSDTAAELIDFSMKIDFFARFLNNIVSKINRKPVESSKSYKNRQKFELQTPRF